MGVCVQCRDTVVDTAKYIGGRLTAPAGGDSSADSKVREGQRDMEGAADKAKAHGHGLMDRAREAYGDAKHQVSESVEDAKHRVSETAEQARQRARDAADRARPHTVEVPHILKWLAQLCPSCQQVVLRARMCGYRLVTQTSQDGSIAMNCAVMIRCRPHGMRAGGGEGGGLPAQQHS